ncbi:hypothetical protein [Halalkalibacterium ligniniphilum]|nr:hypothetical protein [Halalkalibacterium ligniniphilum]
MENEEWYEASVQDEEVTKSFRTHPFIEKASLRIRFHSCGKSEPLTLI